MRRITQGLVGIKVPQGTGSPYLRGWGYLSKWYWPAASAGSPSISPAFDAHWNNTTGADRVLARITKKYGTSQETKTVTTNNVHNWNLIRQYVTPLPGSIWMPQHDNSTNFVEGLVSFFSVPGRFSTIETTRIGKYLYLCRVVDAGGTTVNPARTITVTLNAGPSLTMTSSGAFSASDVGKRFYIQNRDNYWGAAVGSPSNNPSVIINSIAAFTNSSTVTLTWDVGAASTMNGSGRTLVFVEEPDKASAHEGGFTITDGTNNYVDVGAGFNGFSLAKNIWPTYYLVTEVGVQYSAETGAPSRNINTKFGDPSDTLIVDSSNLNDSTGGYLFWTGQAPFMHQ